MRVVAGAVETLELDARSYGFSAEVSFWVSSEGVTDALFTPFNSTDVIRATLDLANGRLALAGETPTVSTFTGYVSERSFVETVSRDVEGKPILERRYTIRFADAASVFWKEHRPLSLYANKSIRELIDDNLVQGVTLTYDWPELEVPKDILCIGLGSLAKASFYDFVVGIVADLCGVIELDAANGSYRIAKEKSEGDSATELDVECVAALTLLPPLLPRHSTVVLNPFSEATVTKLTVANAVAANGVRRDVVAYTQIEKNAEQRAQIEGDRLRARAHHLRVTFARLPVAFPIPGVQQTVAEGFSARAFAAGKTYRSIALRVSARPPTSNAEPSDWEDPAKRYEVEVTAEFERADDPIGNLPEFTAPVYPVLAEGRVLSASGTDNDRTWHALPGEQDSVTRYRVYVPLWNQTVVVPFVPFGESGHFFFPANKHQRVLLSFDFDGGKVVSFLDWVSKLDTDTQGNQLVMGKRDESRTTLKHVYTDDSPVFTLHRNQWGDTQTLELSEGRFFLEVKADPSQSPPNETYDLTPQTEVAKDSAAAESRAALGTLTGQYQSAMSGASGALDAASSELETNVGSATTELAASLAAVEASLSTQVSDLAALGTELDAKVAAAKASVNQAIEGS